MYLLLVFWRLSVWFIQSATIYNSFRWQFIRLMQIMLSVLYQYLHKWSECYPAVLILLFCLDCILCGGLWKIVLSSRFTFYLITIKYLWLLAKLIFVELLIITLRLYFCNPTPQNICKLLISVVMIVERKLAAILV
jgi:hypothetical protein